MFKELVSGDVVAEYHIAADCQNIWEAHAAWCGWMTENSASEHFKWTESELGGVEVRTPVGIVFSVLAFELDAKRKAIGRITFYHRLDPRLSQDPIPVFDIRINDGWEISSGDAEGERSWGQSTGSYWPRSERERLGYEVMLGQMQAAHQIG